MKILFVLFALFFSLTTLAQSALSPMQAYELINQLVFPENCQLTNMTFKAKPYEQLEITVSNQNTNTEQTLVLFDGLISKTLESGQTEISYRYSLNDPDFGSRFFETFDLVYSLVSGQFHVNSISFYSYNGQMGGISEIKEFSCQ